MTIEEIIAPATDWTNDIWGGRIDKAASLLFVHGYITQSQRAKVTQKLDKQYADGIASGQIVERKP